MAQDWASERLVAALMQAGGGAATTWNPNDTGGSVTLSGGNLVATFPTTAFSFVRTTAQISGKAYIEYNRSLTAGSNAGCGIAMSSAGLPNVTSATMVAVIFASGNFFINGTNAVTLGAVGTEVIGVAVDVTARLIWIRRGVLNWNNSATANPATGAGGLSLAALTPPFFGWVCGGPTAGLVWTANFGASAFQNGPPAGFVGVGGGGNVPEAMITRARHGYYADWLATYPISQFERDATAVGGLASLVARWKAGEFRG